ncbi:S1C family serine protease [Spirillospora sp. NBC_01491]|uniref:S1C family serine protease n=1 Tax=Spirillospora sp. NBC_01491 TaxID=2976007 RepID=UPI002E31F7E9|nr:trypsin-like peptidase domain-containing protein [Spirillospora sp. NBC_01491]
MSADQPSFAPHGDQGPWQEQGLQPHPHDVWPTAPDGLPEARFAAGPPAGSPTGPSVPPSAGAPGGPPMSGPPSGGPPAGGPFGPMGPMGPVGPLGPMGVPPQEPFPGGGGAGGPRRTVRRKIVAMGAVLALAVGAGGAGAAVTALLTGPETAYSSPTSVSGASAKAGTAAQVAAAVQPSVVSVQTQTGDGAGTGSGVILRSDGVIMTNAHVVADAQRIAVKFSDGRTAPATLLGSASGSDIAVVKATGVSGLKPATLGDSGSLAVGDQVLAMGSPLGLDGSVTSGIVSALGREIQEGDSGGGSGGSGGQGGLPPGLEQRLSRQETAVIKNAIQTDAAINPGNSGGALVDSAGRVIGINSAIATSGSSSGNIGVGFAIPVNDARQAAQKIIASGSV